MMSMLMMSMLMMLMRGVLMWIKLVNNWRSDHSHTLSAATAATGCLDLYQFVSIKMSLESLQCYDFANVMSIVIKMKLYNGYSVKSR